MKQKINSELSARTADENSTKDDGLHVSPRLHKTKCYKQPGLELWNDDCQIGMKLIADSSVDCILTDPPYLYLKNQKLEREFDEQLFFSECKRVLKKSSFIVLFGRGTSFYRWNTILADLGFTFKEEIIWDKSQTSSPTTPISRVHETIAIYCHSKAGNINSVRFPYLEEKIDFANIIQDIKRIKSALGNIKEFSDIEHYLKTGQTKFQTLEKPLGRSVTVQSRLKQRSRGLATVKSITEGMRAKSIIKQVGEHYTSIHPTQKPVVLLERLLALTTVKDDIVLDAFSGSGSTALACWNTGRKFMGYEIDEEYFNASVERIKKETASPELFR